MASSRFRISAVFPLFFSLFPFSVTCAQDNFDEVVITATQITPTIWMLQGQGGNMAVSVGEDGVLLVDDQFAPLADRIKDKIRELGGDAPAFLLNTHFHGDHSGGNEMFADRATIIAHDRVRLRMADPLNGRVAEALPVITYGDTMSLHFNGEEIRLIHLPAGHTDGDTAVWFTESGVVHMGDQFFAIRFPFVDLQNGGSVEGLVANLELMLGLLPESVQLIPGHGALSSHADFSRFVAGVKDTVALTTARIQAGANLETLVATGLPEEYEEWGQGFISEQAWLTAIYESTTGE